jgi:hypothetical protein
MEVTGQGTHGPSEVGIHHLGMNGIEDPEAVLAELEGKGVPHDGRALNPEGLIHLFFTDKRVLDGIRLEFVSTRRGPTVQDDGSALWRNPETDRVDFFLPNGPDAA